MSDMFPHLVLLLVGVAVWYFVMDIAHAIGDEDMPWWFKYVVAVCIFALLAGVELYLGGYFLILVVPVALPRGLHVPQGKSENLWFSDVLASRLRRDVEVIPRPKGRGS